MNNPFSQALNIGGGDDPFYRYKMPSLSVKIESKNGGTTVIDNIDTIAEKLNRQSSELQKYFRKALSCSVRYDKEKGLIIPALKEVEDLQEILTKYIDESVLCPNCQNPETVKTVKKKTVSLTCAACGKTSNIS